MAARMWLSVKDEFNERTFRCLVEVSYFRRIPKEEELVTFSKFSMGTKYNLSGESITYGGTPLPSSFYNPVNSDQMETSLVSAYSLLDMYTKKVMFEILNDLDVVHIFHLCDRYLEYAKTGIINNVQVVIDFCRDLINFRQTFLYPCFRRVVCKYPTLASAYRTYGTGINDVWLSLFGAEDAGVKDGLERLRKPPYELEALQPSALPSRPKVSNNLDADASDGMEFLEHDLFKQWGG